MTAGAVGVNLATDIGKAVSGGIMLVMVETALMDKESLATVQDVEETSVITVVAHETMEREHPDHKEITATALADQESMAMAHTHGVSMVIDDGHQETLVTALVPLDNMVTGLIDRVSMGKAIIAQQTIALRKSGMR